MKERLVGAAVLVAIAVWLIPWVLDGPEAPLETSGSALQLPAAEEPMPMRTQTLRLGDAPAGESAAAATATAVEPSPAELPPATIPADVASTSSDAPTIAALRPEPEPEPEPETSAPAASSPPAGAPKPPPKPAAATAPATGDWTVQLGSFSEEANARRLAQRAGTFGYKAEVSSYRSGARTLYRVRVGPARARAEADATASALKAHGVDARVVAAR